MEKDINSAKPPDWMLRDDACSPGVVNGAREAIATQKIINENYEERIRLLEERMNWRVDDLLQLHKRIEALTNVVQAVCKGVDEINEGRGV